MQNENSQLLTIAVLGGTGKAGRFVVDELVRQGMHVKMLVRSPEKAPAKHPAIEIVLGSARNYSTIQRLISDCDAVISTLGPSKTETDICSVSARHVIGVMKQINIKRYIEIAGLGLTVPGDNRNILTRLITWAIRTFSPATVKDRQLTYEILSSSRINWTIIRCPTIEMSGKRKNIKVGMEDNPGFKVTAADLAYFIVEQIHSHEYLKKCPFISSS